MSRKAAHEREGNSNAGGGGQKILYPHAQHLSQVAHRHFAAVALPICVRDKTHGSVECLIGGDSFEALRIKRQPTLNTLQDI